MLYQAALHLVRAIAADGEGAGKLIEVRVTGARDDAQALTRAPPARAGRGAALARQGQSRVVVREVGRGVRRGGQPCQLRQLQAGVEG